MFVSAPKYIIRSPTIHGLVRDDKCRQELRTGIISGAQVPLRGSRGAAAEPDVAEEASAAGVEGTDSGFSGHVGHVLTLFHKGHIDRP